MGLFSNKKDKEIEKLKKANEKKDRQITHLKMLCAEKDHYFDEMISDGLRNGSSLAARHMRNKRDYLNKK